MGSTLRDAYERWRNATDRAKGTYMVREVALRCLERGGIVTLEHARDPRMVAAFCEARLAAGCARRTIARDVVTITVILEYLRKAGELCRADVDLIRDLIPKVRKQKSRTCTILEVLECDRLAAIARDLGYPQTEMAIRIVQWAGLRTGELVGLCAEHVDFARRHVRVVHDSRVRGRTGLKTGERLVPLCRELRDFLQGKLPSSGPIFPCTRMTRSGRTVVSNECLREGLRRAARLSGIKGKKIDFKILRRTRETTWASHPKVTRADLSEWMGHGMDVGEDFYLAARAGYAESCETPEDLSFKTTSVLRHEQGRTTTVLLAEEELERLRAIEQAYLSLRNGT